jgi:hypothetical protein
VTLPDATDFLDMGAPVNGSDTYQISEISEHTRALTLIDKSNAVKKKSKLRRRTMRSLGCQGKPHQRMKSWDPIFSEDRKLRDAPLLPLHIEGTTQDRLKIFLLAELSTSMPSFEPETLASYFCEKNERDIQGYDVPKAWVDIRYQQDDTKWSNGSRPQWLTPVKLRQVLKEVSTHPSHAHI